MKKRILLMVSAMLLTLIFLTGRGNKQIFDTTYTFNRAIIQLQDGTVVDTKIKSWNDYDGEQLQVIAADGTVYLTSSFNCTLIKE